MHEFVSFNRQRVSVLGASITALSPAALFGKGIFTTVAIFDGKPFLWEKHWRRLENNAGKLNVDLTSYSESSTRKALEETIQTNSVSNGRARLTFFDETPGKIWPFEKTRETSLLITTADRSPVSDIFRVTVSPHRAYSLSPLAGIKSCNYLDKFLALDEAKSRGFDEAIQMNERGEVSSAVMANVFWLKDEVLYTPSLKTGCLPGTTRELVLENVECREVEATLDALNTADAIFLTSAGIGIVAVSELEARNFGPTFHPIMGLMSLASKVA